MNKFKKLTSTCFMIREENIDTDQIIPARFLKITTREGFGKYLFYDWRYDKAGKAKKSDFNDKAYKKSQILVAGNNFGCGSSREHAVWALSDFGIKVVVSSSFGDIFYSNCLKNDLLPVTISPGELVILFKILKEKKLVLVTVDLLNQTLSCHAGLVSASKRKKEIPKPACRLPAGRQARVRDDKQLVCHFPIDPFRKSCLLKGVDELGYILSHRKLIEEYEKKRRYFL